MRPITPGTTLRLWLDWTELPRFHPLDVATEPDHSLRSIWVRIFPLVSLPLGDPYQNTQDYDHLSLNNSGYVRVFSLSSKQMIGRGKAVDLDFAAGSLKIDSQTYALQPYWVVPEVSSTTTTASWDKGQVRSQMRGGFVVKKSIHTSPDLPAPRELWSVINVVGVNEYLQAVVPSEVIASWKPETLRAQAIAARTYGMFEVAEARAQGQDYDVDPSTWYQSYQGTAFWNATTGKWRNVELAATTAAVAGTKGEVILYGGELIKAYFSANSGGRTCLVSECLEQDSNPPYIAEVDDNDKIRSAPGGTWGTKATLTSDNIRMVLHAVGLTIPAAAAKKLESLERGPSGRTWRLRVDFADGSSLDLDRAQTRKIMHLYGPIRSFLYTLGTVGTDGKQAIKGYGYGHGVGMSQWGAQLFAKQGWKAEAILQYYYHNVTINDLSGGLL